MYRIKNISLGNGVPFFEPRGRFSSSGNGVRNPVPDLSSRLLGNNPALDDIGYHVWVLCICPPT